jgi:S-formylglutathione hydrolase FrmB
MRIISRKNLLVAGITAITGCTASQPGTKDPTETTATSDAVNVVSSSGITVTATRWISDRTLEADVSTPLIDPGTLNAPNRIRVTFPENYANTTDRYPVVYLLHGGAGGDTAQWTTEGGDAEGITDEHPVITVMAEGGKVGWFTDWVDGSAQKWATYYETQVIPWTDANLRTVASKNGRAIGGLSMGGYGAVRFAQDRPDLFGATASFSGAVDLGEFGTRIVIEEQCIQNLLNPLGPFGNPFPGLDSVWNAEDPVRRVAQLAGVKTLMYAGAGTSVADIVERTMGDSNNNLAKAMTKAGLPYMFWMYGVPGPNSPYGCDGGHDFTCWNFAFNDALPRMISDLELPPVAPGQVISANGGFERGLASWTCYGPCNVDNNAGFQHSGTNNGWVRNDNGWNDLHQIIDVEPNRSYTLTGWLRTSTFGDVDGYFGVRTEGNSVINEYHYGQLGDYTQVTVNFNSGSNTELVVYGGFWANSDTFLQLDDVSIVAN